MSAEGAIAASSPEEDPIRAELFGPERLEQHAESLAAADRITERPTRGRDLLPRLAENPEIVLYDLLFGLHCMPQATAGPTMLEGIFGNASAEKVLLYLEQYEEGYATAIARTFDDLSLNMAQRQLERFERAGALVSSLRGRTRLYTWNPRYPFRRELRALLRRALDQLPASERKRYFTERRRPRRAGKPL